MSGHVETEEADDPQHPKYDDGREQELSMVQEGQGCDYIRITAFRLFAAAT